MLRIILIATLLSLSGCAGKAPVMEKPIQVYNGAPEVGGICRLNDSKITQLAEVLKVPENILRANLAQGMDCIDAHDPRFQQFGCMTFDDIGVVQRYIETLKFECKVWKNTPLGNAISGSN